MVLNRAGYFDLISTGEENRKGWTDSGASRRCRYCVAPDAERHRLFAKGYRQVYCAHVRGRWGLRLHPPRIRRGPSQKTRPWGFLVQGSSPSCLSGPKMVIEPEPDGFGSYSEPIQHYFQRRADHGSEVKDYGHLDDGTPERKYSPLVVKQVIRTPIWGDPNPDYISTAYVERQNLTMRMSMRRFTRLTNGFLKRAENLQRALALYFMHYNFCRRHSTIKTTPAIKAGLTDRIWTLHDLANLPDLMRGGLAA